VAREIDHPTEILDLVDGNDQVIGTIHRQQILELEKTKAGYARACLIFLLSPESRIWIPTRADHKKVAPGGYDASIGEHVSQGETYDQAAIRGLVEETNIQAQPALLHHVGDIPPFGGMPYFHRVYTYPAQDVPSYDPEDYSSAQWLRPQELRQLLLDGAKAKEVLLPAVDLLIAKEQHA
jgi:8-oxo-dGTP pyrophosphatase MutT (NUDIX family)